MFKYVLLLLLCMVCFFADLRRSGCSRSFWTRTTKTRASTACWWSTLFHFSLLVFIINFHLLIFVFVVQFCIYSAGPLFYQFEEKRLLQKYFDENNQDTGKHLFHGGRPRSFFVPHFHRSFLFLCCHFLCFIFLFLL